jgi:predicted Rossmann fold nucleotide-binding protein DprA/Smf involved in DNA uptake
MITKEDMAWFALTFYAGLSHAVVHNVLDPWFEDYDSSVCALLEESEDVWDEMDLDDLTIEALGRAAKRMDDARKVLSPLDIAGLSIVRADMPEYPKALVESLGQSRPPMLFCAGNTQLFNEPCVSIIGSRKTLSRTLEFTREVAGAFGRDGVVVVSGYAEGVDRCASHAALEAGGKTVLFLAQGLLTFGHSGGSLTSGIDGGKVLVASAFRPRADWQTPLAMARNAMITGMSRDVIVSQVGTSGGAWEASRMALNQHKRVWVRGDDKPGLGHEGLAALGAHLLEYPSEYLPVWRREITDRAYEDYIEAPAIPEPESVLREAEVVRVLREGSAADIHDASGLTGHLLLKIVEGREMVSLERIDDLVHIKGLGAKAIQQVCDAFGYDASADMSLRKAEQERADRQAGKHRANKKKSPEKEAKAAKKKAEAAPSPPPPPPAAVDLDLFPELDEFSSWKGMPEEGKK